MGNIVKENSVFLFGNTIFENGAVGFIITFLITVIIAKIFSTILEKLVDHAMKKDARASMPFKYLLKILRTVIYVIETFTERFYSNTRCNECYDGCCWFSCTGNVR